MRRDLGCSQALTPSCYTFQFTCIPKTFRNTCLHRMLSTQQQTGEAEPCPQAAYAQGEQTATEHGHTGEMNRRGKERWSDAGEVGLQT